MKRIKLLILLLLTGMVSLSAQTSRERDYVMAQMVPNHADWCYSLREDPAVELSIRRAYCPLPNMEVHLEWGYELRDAERRWTINTGKDGIVRLKLRAADVPGFKTLKATFTYEDIEYSNILNLAFEPQNIQPTTQMPKDFLSFWEKALSDARKIPLSPVVTHRPDCDSEDYIAYEVRFCNDATNRYMYGMLQIPRDSNGMEMKGRLPVVIEWPGAGVKPHRGLKTHLSRKGIIVLEMGVNGIPIAEASDEIYSTLRNGALRQYQTIHLEDRERYYYRSIYVGTVRTVDFLSTLDCVDMDHIAATGGSQGGALSIIHAALDSRIKAVGAAYPALCEMTGYVRGRVAGWPQLFRNPEREQGLPDKTKTCEYYDVVNFARIIRCPIMFFIGYNDRVCCPTSTYSAYHEALRSSSNCRILVAQDCAHWQYAEHRRMRHDFVASFIER